MLKTKSDTGDFVYELYSSMNKDNLNYIYCGDFSQNFIDRILSLTDTNLESIGETKKIKKEDIFYNGRVFTKYNKAP